MELMCLFSLFSTLIAHRQSGSGGKVHRVAAMVHVPLSAGDGQGST